MLTLAVLLSVVALVWGQDAGGCCIPDQWEGYAGELTALSSFFSRGRLIGEALTLSYDYKNKKFAETFYFNVRNQTVTASFIFDFANQKVYRFYKAKKYCRSKSIKAQFKRFCIPASAKSLGSFYFGAGSNKLQAKSFAFFIPKLKYGITTTVTASGCIPIGELIVGQRRHVRFVTNIGFANITPGIKDPSVFTPPSYCKSEFKEFEDELEEDLDRFMIEYIHNRFIDF